MRSRFIIGLLLMAMLFLSYQYYLHRNFHTNGVYAIGRIVRYEADEQGGTMVYEVYFNQRKYLAKTTHTEGHEVGKYYFLRIIPDKPEQIGWEGSEVPACILSGIIPNQGWKKIPSCSQ